MKIDKTIYKIIHCSKSEKSVGGCTVLSLKSEKTAWHTISGRSPSVHDATSSCVSTRCCSHIHISSLTVIPSWLIVDNPAGQPKQAYKHWNWLHNSKLLSHGAFHSHNDFSCLDLDTFTEPKYVNITIFPQHRNYNCLCTIDLHSVHRVRHKCLHCDSNCVQVMVETNSAWVSIIDIFRPCQALILPLPTYSCSFCVRPMSCDKASRTLSKLSLSRGLGVGVTDLGGAMVLDGEGVGEGERRWSDGARPPWVPAIEGVTVRSSPTQTHKQIQLPVKEHDTKFILLSSAHSCLMRQNSLS